MSLFFFEILGFKSKKEGEFIMHTPLKPCNEPGCPTLTRKSYCEQHKRDKPAYDQYRESAARRGMTANGGRQDRGTCRSILSVFPA